MRAVRGRLNSGASVGSNMAAALLRELGSLWVPNLRIWATQALRVSPQSCIHTSASLDVSRKWEKKNNIVYPPQLPGEPRRPAEIYHCRRQIKYSKDKMWYLAKLVLLEAQEMAVRNHNVEFRSNLYIAQSTSGRGQCLKRLRYHARGRFGIMEKVYCHYFVKLVEGPPPPPEAPKTAVDHAKEYIQQLRNRTIIHAL
ncbi:large ribosomal subunit protein uL22m isoform X2 [Meriones unguiculatus]|uniref:large ribosomal subunit protein uL22m isoform X2 n=1 Tax=Meriones unguiculatus TaxID=10047 RepID=UPI00293E78B0|nr:large ribosomal subunit protein uL22m isoform X2 [Meriones unguiculatus]